MAHYDCKAFLQTENTTEDCFLVKWQISLVSNYETINSRSVKSSGYFSDQYAIIYQ